MKESQYEFDFNTVSEQKKRDEKVKSPLNLLIDEYIKKERAEHMDKAHRHVYGWEKNENKEKALNFNESDISLMSFIALNKKRFEELGFSVSENGYSETVSAVVEVLTDRIRQKISLKEIDQENGEAVIEKMNNLALAFKVGIEKNIAKKTSDKQEKLDIAIEPKKVPDHQEAEKKRDPWGVGAGLSDSDLE